MGLFDSVPSSLSQVTSALGIPNPLAGTTPTNAKAPDSTPVNTNPPSDLSRKIQGFSTTQQQHNWNGGGNEFPYFLKIAQVDPSGQVVNNNVSVPDSILSAMGLQKDTFRFYIAPSSISIQNMFAVNVAATNQGVLEENNGLVFRMIQLAGTTGLLPAKTSRAKTTKPGVLAAAQSLFPSTTAAISGLVQNAKSVAKAVVGGNDNDLSDINAKLDYTLTGWFQFWQMNNFLIAYSEFKKKQQGSGLRLIFGSSKDNIGYVVSPLSFTMRRDINNPLLYRYDIQFKAWDIVVNLSVPKLPQADIPSPDSQAIIKSLTEVLTTSRQTIQSATNVLQGVSSDLLSVYNVYNQALLLYQDTAGLVTDVRTFFPTFIAQRQALLLNSDRNKSAVLSAVNDPSVRSGNTPEVTPAQALPTFQKNQKTRNPSGDTTSTLSGLGVNTSSLTNSTTTPGGEQNSDPQKQSISPQADTLVSKALSTDGFKNLTIDKLDIPAPIQAGIDSTREASQALTAGNVIDLTAKLQAISDNYSISLGSMDPVYASTYNVPSTSTAIHRAPTEDDIITAVALQESKTAFLSTLATGQFFLERDPDPFLTANQTVPTQDFLRTPTSSIAVPFQRGTTLDILAQQYLGDAKRTREIQVLNNLRAPYIDEVGFTQPILGPNGRTFVVTSIDNLVISQKITISSNSAVTTKRTILNIQNIGNSEWRITVDGNPNLSIYTPGSNPTLHAYLPGTVAPGDSILIPSDIVPDQFAAIRPTPLYDMLSNAEKVFLVDIALAGQDARDLSVSANGDVQLSYGYTNAAQALRLAVEIEQGELDRHPNYGLATPVGSRNSGLTSAQIEAVIQNTILNDSRFSNADAGVTVNGDVVHVSVNAQGAAGSGQIPVTFEVGKV
jgi:hypothetical protein